MSKQHSFAAPEYAVVKRMPQILRSTLTCTATLQPPIIIRRGQEPYTS
jgi:hypothetical protein